MNGGVAANEKIIYHRPPFPSPAGSAYPCRPVPQNRKKETRAHKTGSLDRLANHAGHVKGTREEKKNNNEETKKKKPHGEGRGGVRCITRHQISEPKLFTEQREVQKGRDEELDETRTKSRRIFSTSRRARTRA